ncbi:MAG: LptF/LptG family permease [Alphaproteobacteria bacterium]|nr:LptF/LptG family permease [Alphaproteobacteria bacterium]MCL2890156.1 LptF/LptG family permease [Alphaproteobacteria bacterium]
MQIKPKILTRFLMRRFLSAFLIVLAVVAGIIFTITFVEKLPSFPSAVDAARISFALILEYVPLMLPLVAFMGTLLAMYNLTRSSEGVIISGAGLSPYKTMRPFLIIITIIGIIATLVVNPMAIRMNQNNLNAGSIDLVDNAVWLRESNDGQIFTMRATGIRMTDANKMIFTNAAAFVQSAESKFKERIESREITLTQDGQFKATNVTVFGPNGAPITRRTWEIDTLMSPDNVLERHLKPEQVSFWKLPNFIKSLSQMGLNTRGHLIQFWKLLFLPLVLIAMVVLGFAFSQTNERRNFSFGIKFSIGILTCFILYFITNVFAALGVSGSLPTVIAVLVPPMIILSAAAFFIVSFDTI